MLGMHAMDKPLDILIKTRAQDLVPFVQLQADLTRHCRLHGRIYVVVHAHEFRQIFDVVEKGNTVLIAEDVAGAAGYTAKLPDTWYTQQIIKIVAANIVEHEHYLILDSDTLIGFDFSEQHFISRGNFVYAVNDFRDVAWELQSRNFLRLRTACRLAGFRAANQIFAKKNVHALIDTIESLYDENIVATLLKYSDELSTDFWTEFALYGVFIQSRQEPPEHCFEERLDLVHFSLRTDFGQFLRDIEVQTPLMIKFHKRRPRRYDLTLDDYRRHVCEIKRVYQRRLETGDLR
jgi:Family of unknown function (DUF6492)